MKKITYLLLGLSVLVLGGCANNNFVTKQQAYPKMYQNDPLSILVVPAVNRSTAADAPDLYSTTIAQPLAEAGYYVMPVPLTNMMLQNEGVVDGAQLENVDVSRFRTLFGADAVLFVTINQWDTHYYVTGGDVTVGAEFKLISTTTGEPLWSYNSAVVYNTSGNSGNLLADMISTALTTAMTDYVPVARMVNATVMTTLPAGQYSPRHGKDGNDKTVNQLLQGEQPQAPAAKRPAAHSDISESS